MDFSFETDLMLDVNLSTQEILLYSSTDSTTKSDNDTETAHERMLKAVEEIGYLMHFYYVPVLVLCGGFGNIFSLVVFSRTKLSKLSSSYYLSALAISDTCFLFGLFTQWLNFIDLRIYNRPYFCQFFTFFSNLACFCSAWFVVAFTVERFIAVVYPLRRQVMCTVRRAKITLSIMMLFGVCHCVPFAVYSSPIYIDRTKTVICDIRSELTDNITKLNYWDTLVVFAIPFAIIAVINTLTCCTVWKFAGARRMLTMSPQENNSKKDIPTTGSPDRANERRATSLGRRTLITALADSARFRRKQERCKALNSQIKITRMLMIVSTAFVTLNLPSCVMRMKTYLETQSSANERTTILLQYIFHLLFITNFGINFYLYCLSGQNFRKAVLSMIWPNYGRDGTQVTGSVRFFSQHRRQHHTAPRANSNFLD